MGSEVQIQAPGDEKELGEQGMHSILILPAVGLYVFAPHRTHFPVMLSMYEPQAQAAEGWNVGRAVGKSVGPSVGRGDGTKVGRTVGSAVGCSDGLEVGLAVGSCIHAH